MSDDPKPQADKFKELACKLRADEDEAAFEEAVRKVAAKQPTSPQLNEEALKKAERKMPRNWRDD